MTIVLVWLHLLAAVAWIGGMAFLSLILVPILNDQRFGAQRGALFQTIGRRFRMLVWVTVAVLLTTGPWLVSLRVGSPFEPLSWPTVLKVKVLLVVCLIALTALHDFWLGPRVAHLRREPPASRRAAQTLLVRWAPWVPRLGLILALAILFLASALAR